MIFGKSVCPILNQDRMIYHDICYEKRGNKINIYIPGTMVKSLTRTGIFELECACIIFYHCI